MSCRFPFSLGEESWEVVQALKLVLAIHAGVVGVDMDGVSELLKPLVPLLLGKEKRTKKLLELCRDLMG